MLSGNESNWIVGTQIPAGYGDASGAFRFHPVSVAGSWYIHPYEANVAAWGVLHGGQQYAPAARTWLQWYMDHMDPETGYVPDYTVNVATYDTAPLLSPFGERYYESTDATAATFLTACRKYVEVSGEKTFLRQNKHAVWAAVRAMESTVQDTGLSWARPDRAVHFLANNCERYQALNDVAWMCANVYAEETCDAPQYAQKATDLGREITGRYWDHSNDMFVTALDRDGGGTSSDWAHWQDAADQMWPVLVTLDLWPEEFDTMWPQWTSVSDNPTPGAMVAYTAALAGRHDAARQWLRSARRAYMADGHALPWTIREAAFAVATAWLEDV
jgi:hypothetical protein